MADARPLEDQVRLEYRDKIAWITIDRPEVGNALNPPSRDRIRDLINELNVNHRARCIVLTAAGNKLFCPGADLTHVYENDRADDIPERGIGVRRVGLAGNVIPNQAEEYVRCRRHAGRHSGKQDCPGVKVYRIRSSALGAVLVDEIFEPLGVVCACVAFAIPPFLLAFFLGASVLDPVRLGGLSAIVAGALLAIAVEIDHFCH